MDVSVMAWCQTLCHCQCLPMHPSLMCGTVTCVSKPLCSCQLNQFLGVDVSCQVWTLCKAFRKWYGFGDDVIAEQPSHPCLVIHNTVCHVTPCVFLSFESWLNSVPSGGASLGCNSGEGNEKQFAMNSNCFAKKKKKKDNVGSAVISQIDF